MNRTRLTGLSLLAAGALSLSACANDSDSDSPDKSTSATSTNEQNMDNPDHNMDVGDSAVIKTPGSKGEIKLTLTGVTYPTDDYAAKWDTGLDETSENGQYIVASFTAQAGNVATPMSTTAEWVLYGDEHTVDENDGEEGPWVGRLPDIEHKLQPHQERPFTVTIDSHGKGGTLAYDSQLDQDTIASWDLPEKETGPASEFLDDAKKDYDKH